MKLEGVGKSYKQPPPLKKNPPKHQAKMVKILIRGLPWIIVGFLKIIFC